MLPQAARYAAAVAALSAAIGVCCFVFLSSLDAVTHFRFAHPGVLYFLPAAGMVCAYCYQKFGGDSHRGSHLILDRIHRPGGGVTGRMAPLVLLGTLLTHLCGGSAGREGTAVQMGGSLAGAAAKRLGLEPHATSLLLRAGVAGGFGAVFGTPLAGAVFAVEVCRPDTRRARAFAVCLFAAGMADLVCRLCGGEHTLWTPVSFGFAPLTLAACLPAGAAFGLCARLFVSLSRRAAALFARGFASPPPRAAVGGALVILLVWLTGTRDYLGLGVYSPDPGAATLPAFFLENRTLPWAWAWKIAFTVITLSGGFKGGEVTPLFFIGAGLGHSLALLTGQPVALFAAMGFLSVFGAAARAPLACVIMGMELFGVSAAAVPFAIAAFTANACAGPVGIYGARRV